MMNYYGNYGYGYGMGYEHFSALHFLGEVLLTVLIVWIIFRLIFGRRGLRRHGHSHGMWKDQSAVGILDERFAKGEIDKAEYEERKKALLG